MRQGTLFYVVGASGAGKDTLIGYARKLLIHQPVRFARRHITRRTGPGEDHLPVSSQEFHYRKESNLYALWWDSHGYSYGISREIDQWLTQGCVVVVNGSRGYHSAAIKRYPAMVTVLVEVSPTVLRERLQQRGRESTAEIDQRIKRSQKFADFMAPNLVRINNDLPLEVSGQHFTDAILAAVLNFSDRRLED